MTACASACARPGEDLRDLYERTRAAGFGAEVRRRVLIGTYVLSAGYYDAYYLRAQKVRALILRDFTEVFAQGGCAGRRRPRRRRHSRRARTWTIRSRCI